MQKKSETKHIPIIEYLECKEPAHSKSLLEEFPLRETFCPRFFLGFLGLSQSIEVCGKTDHALMELKKILEQHLLEPEEQPNFTHIQPGSGIIAKHEEKKFFITYRGNRTFEIMRIR